MLNRLETFCLARMRAVAHVFPVCTPPRTQALLLLLPRAIKVMSFPVLLLAVVGDTSGLLGLLCFVLLLLIAACIGLFGASFMHAWKYEVAQRQQERQPRGRMNLIRATSEENVFLVLYAAQLTSQSGLQADDHPQSTAQYADYEQPQTQYPL